MKEPLPPESTPADAPRAALAGTPRATPAADVLAAAYRALNVSEREEAFVKISDIRLAEIAGADDEIAVYVGSLRRAAEVGGGAPVDLSPDLYRRARNELLRRDEEIIEFNQLVRYFGSWRQAKEAALLSETDTPRKIEARFRSRLVGKPHRYREETLRETLIRCARDLGHVPLVIEFEHWRQREIELAKARGERLFLPSDSPYRRRWGTWEDALLHFGFSSEAVAERLEPGRTVGNANLAPFQYRPGQTLTKRGGGV